MTLVGDPIQMRSHAEAWRRQALELREHGQRQQTQSSRLEFQGPAAARFHDAVATNVRQISALATELEHIARVLDADSGRVERSQQDDRRAAQEAQRRRDEEERRRRAHGSHRR